MSQAKQNGSCNKSKAMNLGKKQVGKRGFWGGRISNQNKLYTYMKLAENLKHACTYINV